MSWKNGALGVAFVTAAIFVYAIHLAQPHDRHGNLRLFVIAAVMSALISAMMLGGSWILSGPSDPRSAKRLPKRFVRVRPYLIGITMLASLFQLVRLLVIHR
jgi:hypothetical protein